MKTLTLKFEDGDIITVDLKFINDIYYKRWYDERHHPTYTVYFKSISSGQLYNVANINLNPENGEINNEKLYSDIMTATMHGTLYGIRYEDDYNVVITPHDIGIHQILPEKKSVPACNKT